MSFFETQGWRTLLISYPRGVRTDLFDCFTQSPIIGTLVGWPGLWGMPVILCLALRRQYMFHRSFRSPFIFRENLTRYIDINKKLSLS